MTEDIEENTQTMEPVTSKTKGPVLILFTES